jgi:acyl carrier protein
LTDEHKILELVMAETGHVADLDTDLDSLKMDSLDFIDFVLECEKLFKVKIEQSTIIRMNTVGDVLEIIQEARGV